MIAYNKTWLDNLVIHQQVEKVVDSELIDQTECNDIKVQYPVGFFTANIFVRIGLFILTLIVASFSFGLLSMLMMEVMRDSISGMSIFAGLLSYTALEIMVKSKHHFKSGVDDALIWMSASFMFGGIAYGTSASELGMCFIAFILACFYIIRFSNGIAAISAFIAFIGLVFFACSKMGGIVKAIVPFVVMVTSAAIYFLAKISEQNEATKYYRQCLTILKVAALLTFYIAGNYLVVRELSNSMFNLNLQEGESIPFAALFWTFTFATPIVYMAAGLWKKDSILLRCGLILVAASVLTFRTYYHVVNIEIAMTIAGFVMIAAAIAVIKYLKQPKFGFTYIAPKEKPSLGSLQIESLIIAETFAAQPAQEAGTEFGGGSFGGGGAGNEF